MKSIHACLVELKSVYVHSIAFSSIPYFLEGIHMHSSTFGGGHTHSKASSKVSEALWICAQVCKARKGLIDLLFTSVGCSSTFRRMMPNLNIGNRFSWEWDWWFKIRSMVPINLFDKVRILQEICDQVINFTNIYTTASPSSRAADEWSSLWGINVLGQKLGKKLP